MEMRHTNDKPLDLDCNRERPDIVIEIEGHRAGVELVSYCQAGGRRDVDRAWSNLARMAYNHQNFPNRNRVILHFIKRLMPNANDRQDFIRSVFEVSRHENSHVKVITSGLAEFPVLGKYLKRIDLQPINPIFREIEPEPVPWRWQEDECEIGATEEELITLVEKKLASFEGFNDERWLLIHEAPLIYDETLQAVESNWVTRMGLLDRICMENMTALTNRIECSQLDRFILLHCYVTEWQRGKGWNDYYPPGFFSD